MLINQSIDVFASSGFISLMQTLDLHLRDALASVGNVAIKNIEETAPKDTGALSVSFYYMTKFNTGKIPFGKITHHGVDSGDTQVEVGDNPFRERYNKSFAMARRNFIIRHRERQEKSWAKSSSKFRGSKNRGKGRYHGDFNVLTYQPEFSADTHAIIISSVAPYAVPVNYGTANMAGRYFVEEALEFVMDDFERGMVQSIESALKNHRKQMVVNELKRRGITLDGI